MLLSLIVIQLAFSLSVSQFETLSSCIFLSILNSYIGCSIGSIQCVNVQGIPMHDRRSRYIQKCETGKWSGTMLLPDEKICYLDSILPASYCGSMGPKPQCSFSGFKCLNEMGTITDSVCTSQYN